MFLKSFAALEFELNAHCTRFTVPYNKVQKRWSQPSAMGTFDPTLMREDKENNSKQSRMRRENIDLYTWMRKEQKFTFWRFTML